MEKGTNTSKCREVEYGCSLRPSKALTNDGFRIGFSVNTTGFLPDHDFVRELTYRVQKYLAALMNEAIAERSFSDLVPDLFDFSEGKRIVSSSDEPDF